MECSICGNEIEKKVFRDGSIDDEGHNAEPINSGRCCDKCNATKVIPARLSKIVKRNKQEVR